MHEHSQADSCYTRSLDLDPENKAVWMMKAFVLEQIGDHQGAIACYDKAIGIDGKDKIPWNSKGLVMMNLNKYDKALRCFDMALELDPSFSTALEGKKMAEANMRATQIETMARKILEFEYEHNRAMTREDAFKNLKISSQNLDDVFAMLRGMDPIDLTQLTPAQMEDLERKSNAVLRRCVGTGGDYGLRLCDITHNFTDYSVEESKRILSYIEKVSSLALKPEATPELDGLVRRAMDLPQEQRTTLGLVRNLNIGVYQAKKVQVNLSMFKGEGYEPQAIKMEPIMGQDYHPEMKAPSAEPKAREPRPKKEAPSKIKGAFEDKMCRNHNAQAVTQHRCGQYLCNACVKGEENCPICGLPLDEDRAPRPGTVHEEREEDSTRDFSRL
jgi:tetratricopeptide (TPR) repeat protein